MLLSVFAVGCGGDEGGDFTIADSPLSGKIGGESWTFKSGFSDSFLSDDKGFFVSLYPEAVADCSSSPPTGDSILIKIPKQAGTYEFSLNNNMTLVDDGPDGPDNLVVTTGVLEVKEVSDTTITAGLYGIYGNDPNNEVSGQFTVTLCPAMP